MAKGLGSSQPKVSSGSQGFHAPWVSVDSKNDECVCDAWPPLSSLALGILFLSLLARSAGHATPADHLVQALRLPSPQ
eukprot:8576873-Pyramimonas_sp.AAC.1